MYWRGGWGGPGIIKQIQKTKKLQLINMHFGSMVKMGLVSRIRAILTAVSLLMS